MDGALVLLETSGNQAFIFGTNKLRENVGASHMIWRSSMELVLRNLANNLFDKNPVDTRQKLRSNRGKLPSGCEIFTIASGKALFRMPDIDKAHQLVEHVTRAALSELPGVELRGAIIECADDLTFDDAVRQVHARLEELRAHVPGPENRFLRLPVVADCTASRYPACFIDEESPEYQSDRPETGLTSVMSGAKRMNRKTGLDRLHAVIGTASTKNLRLVRDLDRLEKDTDKWLAVIHADGNGIGQIFQHFGHIAETRRWSDPGWKMLEFSLALDECGERAFAKALEKAHEKWKGKQGSSNELLPVVPLVLGGDDLTVVCDGRMAVQLARDYLEAFEKETANHRAISELAENVLGVPRLGACAGIAIIKPHFPFHLAYELAEALLKAAKKVKRYVKHSDREIHGNQPFPCSALDFHVHYDASGADLGRIRELLISASGARLYAGPYVVTPTEHLAAADNRSWVQAHAFSRLESGIEALHQQDEDKQIPRSTLHELREALFLDEAQAEDRQRLVLKRRAQDQNLRGLLKALDHDERDGEPSLFRHERDPDREKEIAVSGLLDVMDLRELWQ